MTILSWIILGAVAGMLASQIVGAEEKGCVVNIVLGNQPDSYLADMNNDGQTNILDVIILVNLIISP